MSDYGGLRTRVNPLTGEIEYDDTPEPVAQPLSSEPKAAAAPLSLTPRINVATEPPASREARNQAGSVLATASGRPFLPEMAPPMTVAEASRGPVASPAPVEPPMPSGGAPPIVPKISPTMSTAEIADPHAMAELNADPVHKRNIFSKILAGLAGAYYGSQGRIDLAQQIGQMPRLQHEQQVKELEGRYRTQNEDLTGRQNREIAIGRQTAADARDAAQEARAAELQPILVRRGLAEAADSEAQAAQRKYEVDHPRSTYKDPETRSVQNADGSQTLWERGEGGWHPAPLDRGAPPPQLSPEEFEAKVKQLGIKPGTPQYDNAKAANAKLPPRYGTGTVTSAPKPTTPRAVSESELKNRLVQKFGKPANTQMPNPQYKDSTGHLTQQGIAIEAQAAQIAANQDPKIIGEGTPYPTFDSLPENRKMALIEAAGKAVGIPVWVTLDQTPEWAAAAEALRSQGVQ